MAGTDRRADVEGRTSDGGDALKEEWAEMNNGKALGFIETVGLAAAIAAADAALKAANVRLVGRENSRGSGCITIKIIGDVGAVKAAIDAARTVAGGVSRVWSSDVIPRPAAGLGDVMVWNKDTQLSEKKSELAPQVPSELVSVSGETGENEKTPSAQAESFAVCEKAADEPADNPPAHDEPVVCCEIDIDEPGGAVPEPEPQVCEPPDEPAPEARPEITPEPEADPEPIPEPAPEPEPEKAESAHSDDASKGARGGQKSAPRHKPKGGRKPK
jgi:microcompartment protein CcmL/EutN